MSDQRMFPIMALSYRADDQIREARKSGCSLLVIQIPWAMLALHEEQAQRNHSQSLNRLAERGGLGADEALAVLEDRRWHSIPIGEAHMRLTRAVQQFLQEQP